MTQADLFDAWVEWAELHNADALDPEQFEQWIAEGRAQ